MTTASGTHRRPRRRRVNRASASAVASASAPRLPGGVTTEVPAVEARLARHVDGTRTTADGRWGALPLTPWAGVRRCECTRRQAHGGRRQRHGAKQARRGSHGPQSARGATLGWVNAPRRDRWRRGGRERRADDVVVLAVDLGTGGPKAAVVSPTGRIAASASEPVALHLLPGGGAEQDPAAWWAAIVAAARRALELLGVSRSSVVGIGCTAQWSGHGGRRRLGGAVAAAP